MHTLSDQSTSMKDAPTEQTKMPQVIDVFFTESKPFFKHWILLEKVAYVNPPENQY